MSKTQFSPEVLFEQVRAAMSDPHDPIHVSGNLTQEDSDRRDAVIGNAGDIGNDFLTGLTGVWLPFFDPIIDDVAESFIERFEELLGQLSVATDRACASLRCSWQLGERSITEQRVTALYLVSQLAEVVGALTPDLQLLTRKTIERAPVLYMSSNEIKDFFDEFSTRGKVHLVRPDSLLSPSHVRNAIAWNPSNARQALIAARDSLTLMRGQYPSLPHSVRARLAVNTPSKAATSAARIAKSIATPSDLPRSSVYHVELDNPTHSDAALKGLDERTRELTDDYDLTESEARYLARNNRRTHFAAAERFLALVPALAERNPDRSLASIRREALRAPGKVERTLTRGG